MAGIIHTRIYNPQVDDFDMIAASVVPNVLVGVTVLSPTAIRVTFAPADLPSVTPPTKVSLPPYVKPPRH
jgi:hypothetical protein